jgi:hypothetical protein
MATCDENPHWVWALITGLWVTGPTHPPTFEAAAGDVK